MNKRVLYGIIIAVVTMIITSIISYSVYAVATKTKRYDYHLKQGYTLMDEGKYEEAIIEFEKAINIEKKTTAPRIGIARAYFGNGQYEEAEDAIKTAFELDKMDPEVILTAVDVLKIYNPDLVYEMLMEYFELVDEENADRRVVDIRNRMSADPLTPEFVPEPGEYAGVLDISVDLTNQPPCSKVFYTLDQSEPTPDSERLREPITLENDTATVRVIVYNVLGVGSEIVMGEFRAETYPKEELGNLIDRANELYDNTEVGTDVGCCVEGAKEPLKNAIDTATYAYNLEYLTIEKAQAMIDGMREAITIFKNNTIVETTRTALENTITNANDLINTRTEGENQGNNRVGSKAVLRSKITAAQEVYDNILARQNDIDTAEENLKGAITTFENDVVTEREARLNTVLKQYGANTGNVTISLGWYTSDDIDLHVVTPKGDEISFMNSYSSISTGRLDIDRQVSTFVDNPVENIYFSNPPRGTYRVYIRNYLDRTEGSSTPYIVKVRYGDEIEIYEGYIGDYGDVTICQFTY